MAACLLRDQQNDLKICHLDKAWNRRESGRMVIFFFPDYITWPKHPLQLSEHFLFAQSCFQLRVRTNRKMRSTPEINVSFLHRIFFQSRYSCLSPQLGCSCEMTATSVRLFPTNNTRGNNPFCFKKKKKV